MVEEMFEKKTLLQMINPVELIFPHRCICCDELLGMGMIYVCAKCKQKIKYIDEPKCMKCGKQISNEDDPYCGDCMGNQHKYIQGIVLYDYRSMAESIYRFKYLGRKEYAFGYGVNFAQKLGNQIMRWNPQGLVPVPIHAKRKRDRGYNQSLCLARALGKELGIPVYDRLLKRIVNTTPQKKLGVGERQNNLKRAFKIGQNDVKLDTIIIIDDIYTTGSTVDAIAEVLINAGIKNIYYAALTIGVAL